MGMSQSIRAGRAFVELYADSSKLVRGLRKAEGELRRFGAKAQQLGRSMMMAAGMVAAPMALATKVFASFEDEMAKVRAISGALAGDFKKLTDQAKELGRTTSFTATQVAAGMTSLARMGFDTSQIEAAIPAILNLARATDTELAEAAEIAAGAVRGFNLDASETTRVADVLTAAASNSAQTLSELGEAFAYATPIMNQAGESVESVAKSLGIMANMQIKGSRGGTSLQAMGLRMADPKIQAVLKGMGIDALNANKDLRTTSDILSEVGQKMASMGTGARINLAETLFGRRAVGGALNLAGPMDQMQKLIDAVDNAGGTAKRTAVIMDDTLGGAFRMMMSAVEGAGIAIGEALKPELEKLADWIQKNAAAMAKWVEQNKDVIIKIAAVAAGVGALGVGLVVFGAVANGLASVLGLVAMAATGVSTAFTLMLAHPVVAALAGIAVATVALSKGLDYLLSSTIELSDEMAKLRKAGDEQRAGDLKRMGQLDALAKKEKLNSDEMETAQGIIAGLTSRYGDLGLELDSVAGKINGLADAHVQLAESMRQLRESQIQDEIREKQKNVRDLEKEMQAVSDTYMTWTERTKQIAALFEKIKGEQSGISGLIRELEMLRAGAEGALTGSSGPAPGGGVPDSSLGNAESIAAFNLKIERRLHDLKIANIDDEERRAIAAITARYERERKDAPEGVTDFASQQQAEATEIAATQEQFATERKAEQKLLFEDREDRELQIAEETARLRIDATTTDGLDRQLAHIELARKRALSDAAQMGIDPAGIEEQFALEKSIARQSDVKNLAGPEYTAQGSTSGQAIAYYNAGQSGNPMAKTEKNTKDTVKALQDIIAQGGLDALRFT
jgi:TP901 family phage tail tape measure protein